VRADEPAKFGKSVPAAESVKLADLLASPASYVDKTIRVTGKITAVCPHAGCWIDVAGEGSDVVRFKVDDGVIVFPKTVKGKDVVAEGIFRRIELTKEMAIAFARHEADETGKPFDASTITGPVVRYQIEGIGAVVR
jgi:hypothetical protein